MDMNPSQMMSTKGSLIKIHTHLDVKRYQLQMSYLLLVHVCTVLGKDISAEFQQVCPCGRSTRQR